MFKNKIFPKNQIEKYIFTCFFKKYNINDNVYNITVINNIIFNEKTHIVALFKDYLIYDDLSEFLKRYYISYEYNIRLPKFLEYYEKYCIFFPNYLPLFESKYIYQNIHKKQKILDFK